MYIIRCSGIRDTHEALPKRLHGVYENQEIKRKIISQICIKSVDFFVYVLYTILY